MLLSMCLSVNHQNFCPDLVDLEQRVTLLVDGAFFFLAFGIGLMGVEAAGGDICLNRFAALAFSSPCRPLFWRDRDGKDASCDSPLTRAACGDKTFHPESDGRARRRGIRWRAGGRGSSSSESLRDSSPIVEGAVRSSAL